MAKSMFGQARKAIAAKVARAKSAIASPKSRAAVKRTAKKVVGKLLRGASPRLRDVAKGAGRTGKKVYAGHKKFHTAAGEAVKYGIGVHPNYRKAGKRLKQAIRTASKW